MPTMRYPNPSGGESTIVYKDDDEMTEAFAEMSAHFADGRGMWHATRRGDELPPRMTWIPHTVVVELTFDAEIDEDHLLAKMREAKTSLKEAAPPAEAEGA